MGDLQVDYDQLTSSLTTLSTLKSEFDNIEQRTAGGDAVWSHPSVTSAMKDFGGNMDYNRKKLSQRLQTCGEAIDNTLKTFRETDQKLAAELEKGSK